MSKHDVIVMEGSWQPSQIVFVPTEKAWAKTMKQMNNNDAWPGARNRLGAVRWYEEKTDGRSVILIVIANHNRAPAELMSTLVHEAVHVYQFVCQAMGEERPGIETEAYSIQHIYEWLVDCYTKTIGKGVKWQTKGRKRKGRK